MALRAKTVALDSGVKLNSYYTIITISVLVNVIIRHSPEQQVLAPQTLLPSSTLPTPQK